MQGSQLSSIGARSGAKQVSMCFSYASDRRLLPQRATRSRMEHPAVRIYNVTDPCSTLSRLLGPRELQFANRGRPTTD